MSKFYGMVCGNREAATRGGSFDSGFHASAQSYDGSVIVKLRYDGDKKDNGNLLVTVGTSDGSSCYTDWNSPDFHGTFEEFKALLQLARDIKDGKVSVVRHRSESNKMKQLKKMFS